MLHVRPFQESSLGRIVAPPLKIMTKLNFELGEVATRDFLVSSTIIPLSQGTHSMEEFRRLASAKDTIEAEISRTLDALGPEGLTVQLIDGG
jgi:hypothetical protein